MENKGKSNSLLNELYSNDLLENKEAIVSEKGSLALLAYGYRGLIEWRKKRKLIKGQKEESSYEK